MIDTHAHLESCPGGPDAAVAGASEAGVDRVLTIGREQAVELAARHAGVWAIVGWHPHEAAEADVAELRPLLSQPRVVALGEVGLDFYRDNAPREEQRRVFAEQIDLANELGLPLVIHTRDADEETFPMLERARVPVVLHCFSSPGRLSEAASRGYMLSFAGNVTYPKAVELQEAAARTPAELLLAETDSPYLSPVPLRGRPNTPANVTHIVGFLAGLRGVAADELAEQIEQNAARVFGLP
ncbi:MAG TPA: TatD family hydrolase [Gaiellales bacterium]|nr:TatD family hydrolase [Gaiellales bacterium]